MAPSMQDMPAQVVEVTGEAAAEGKGVEVPAASEELHTSKSGEAATSIDRGSCQDAVKNEHATLEDVAGDEQQQDISDMQDDMEEANENSIQQDEEEEEEYEPADHPRPLRFVSIMYLDSLTIDDILDVFYSGKQWWDENAIPIRKQLNKWWEAIHNFMESDAASIPIDELHFTHTIRHFLWQMNFVALPEEIHVSHMQWEAFLPFLEDARREIPRTRGFLALLTHEVIQYEDAWNAFWDLMEDEADNQHEFQKVLSTLFTAMKRFYFLLNSMNVSFFYTFRQFRHMFEGQKPIWYIWDCETWRNEQWEFHKQMLEDRFRDLEVQDSATGNPDEEERNLKATRIS